MIDPGTAFIILIGSIVSFVLFIIGFVALINIKKTVYILNRWAASIDHRIDNSVKLSEATVNQLKRIATILEAEKNLAD